MRQPESNLKERVLFDLRTLPHSWWEKIQQVAIRGTPDILGCLSGLMVALELKKSAKEKPDPLQRFKLVSIHDAGGISLVVNPESWPECFELLKKLAQDLSKLSSNPPLKLAGVLQQRMNQLQLRGNSASPNPSRKKPSLKLCRPLKEES